MKEEFWFVRVTHAFKENEPIRMPGQIIGPYRNTANKARPDAGNTAVP